MKLQILRLSAVLIILGLSLGGCAIFGKKKRSDPENGSGLVKAGTKTQGDRKADSPKMLRPPTLKAKLRFLKAQAMVSSQFTEKERKFVEALKSSPKAGTFAEAALAVGLVKTVLNPLHQKKTSFQETDLVANEEGTTQTTASAGGLSIESLCRERGLDLPSALTNNRNLHTHAIAKIALQSLQGGSNSQQFVQKVKQAVASQAILWNQLGPEVGISGAVAQLPPEPTQDAAVPVADEELSSAPPSPADLRDADAILVEAQALSDNGKHTEAISLAGHVKPGNPMYSAAREKIKGFSNRAVQELRRKAAQAFQSSVPVSDKKIRAEYLQQASTYLEEALKNYPAATHLQRVRDNLRVISQDLERLTQDIAEEGETEH